MRNRFVQAALIGFAASAVALALWFVGGLGWFEGKTWDWRARLMAKPGLATDSIRLILIDQTSLDWGREKHLAWPWPREVYEPIIGFCRRGGAKAILLDLVFTESSASGVDDDRVLGAAIADASNVVTTMFLSFDQGLTTNWPAVLRNNTVRADGLQAFLDTPLAQRLTMPRASFPVDEIATNDSVLGHVYGTPDRDAIVRRVPPFLVFDGHLVPSLAVAGYLTGSPGSVVTPEPHEFRVGDHVVPLDGKGSAILRFRGRSQTHKTVNAAAVIESELRLREGGKPSLDPGLFRNAYVFVGTTAAALLDLKPTPVGKIYPGVEVHATALDNLLSGDFMRPASATATVIATLLLAVLAGWAGRLCQKGWQVVIVFGAFLPLPFLPAFAAYARNVWLPVAPPEIAVALSLVGALILSYALEGRQKRFIKTAFKQYLSPHVIDRLVENPKGLKLGGETRDLSIYFSDVQGFTTISESLTPENLTALLNEYLTAMSDIIMEEGGTVDKYEGDAVIAFWNAPLDLPDHAKCAVRAALRCQKKLAEIRPILKEKYGRDLFCRIGINTGRVVIGNMGSHQRFNYTFLGDAGNLAARLEGANKQFGTYMMISEFTRAQLGDEFAARELSRLRVKGKNKPVGVFEPMLPADYAARREILDCFAAALKAYYDGRFQEALDGFTKIADQDAPARSYVPRCRELAQNPPAAWDGVWELTEK